MRRRESGGRSRGGAPAWFAILLIPAVLAQAAEGDLSSPPRYLLDEEGRLFAWQPGAARLEEAADALLRALGPVSVKDLAPLGGGRLLFLARVSPEPKGGGQTGRRHKRGEGLAVVVDTAAPSRVLREISFPGEGYAVAVTSDRRRAFILAMQPPQTGLPEDTRFWVHEVDPEEGAIVGSVALAGPVLGLAIDPTGRRVFLSAKDRILTCTTNPLRNSWYYRSPGANGVLRFPPGSDVLFAIRDQAIAQFDPKAIGARPESDRHGRSDDATAVISLPAAASDLGFSEDGRLAAAIGTGALMIVDLSRMAVFAIPDLPDPVRSSRHIDLLRFPASPGDLLLASFPSLTVAVIPGRGLETPEPEAPEQAFAAQALPPAPQPLPLAAPTIPPAAPEGSAPEGPAPEVPPAPPPAAPASPAAAPASPSAAPAPEAAPGPQAPPATAVPPPPQRAAEPAPTAGAVMKGRLTGERKMVSAIVLYGPDNIAREVARVKPDDGGAWEIPLPPPGRYRVVPIGDGTRPLRSRPTFQTVVVTEGQGWAAVDFEILGGL